MSRSVVWHLSSEEGQTDLVWQLAHPLNFGRLLVRRVSPSLSALNGLRPTPCCWCWLRLAQQWRLLQTLGLSPWTRRRLTTTHPWRLAVSVGAVSLITFLHVCFQQAVVILVEYGFRNRRFDTWEPLRHLQGRFYVYDGSEGVLLRLDGRARLISPVMQPHSGRTRLYRM